MSFQPKIVHFDDGFESGYDSDGQKMLVYRLWTVNLPLSQMKQLVKKINEDYFKSVLI